MFSCPTCNATVPQDCHCHKPMTAPTRATPFSAEDFEREAAAWLGGIQHRRTLGELTAMLTQAAAMQRALAALVAKVDDTLDMNLWPELADELAAAQAALRGTQ